MRGQAVFVLLGQKAGAIAKGTGKMMVRAKTKTAATVRIVRALALLESFGTEEAMAIIKIMASGDPDAQPTRVANEMELRAKPMETKADGK